MEDTREELQPQAPTPAEPEPETPPPEDAAPSETPSADETSAAPDYVRMTLDAGVPILSMHAPFEVSAKLDCYEAYKTMGAIYKAVF